MTDANPDSAPAAAAVASADGARMIAACTSGDEGAVRQLLHKAPSLAHQVVAGPLAPLHYAVRAGHAGIVQLLLQHGADARVVVEGHWGIPLSTVDVPPRAASPKSSR
jgi:ankyrin repeat protein